MMSSRCSGFSGLFLYTKSLAAKDSRSYEALGVQGVLYKVWGLSRGAKIFFAAL